MLSGSFFGVVAAAAFCGILFAVFLGREALSALSGISAWIRARPFRALVLLPLVGFLVAYAGTKPSPVTPDPPDVPETPVTPVPSVGPELYADKLAKPFAGDATYIGWKRAAEGRIEGLLTIKAGKAAKPAKGGQSKLTVSYTPFSTGKKQSVKLDKSAYPVAGGRTVVPIPGIGRVVFGGESLAGLDSDFQAGADLAKSKDKSVKAAANKRLARMNGMWTFAFETDAGYAGFSLTVSKGKGKLAGTLPDGTKVSVSQQGILGDSALAIPFMYAKKGSLGFVFWLHDGGAVELSDLTALKLANGTVLGASLVEPSAAHRLADGDGRVFETPFFSQAFGVAGKKWNFPKQQKKLGDADPNPYGTKLTFTEKTGVVKGSFSIPGPTGKAQKYTVNGVVVGGTGYGTATLKNSAASWPITIE